MAFIKALFWSFVVLGFFVLIYGTEEKVGLMVAFFMAMLFAYPIIKWCIPAKREYDAKMKLQGR
jgi:hypothetical protein